MENTIKGRKLKKAKINTATKAIAGVINWPARDFYLEASIKRNFQTTEQVEKFKKEIKKELQYLAIEMNADAMEPIIVMSNLEQLSLKRSKNNTLKIDATFYLTKYIYSISEIDEEKIIKSLEKIELIKF